MMHMASHIEEIALDFGKRFSDAAPNSPIKCNKTLRKLVISAALGSGVRYQLAESMAELLLGDPSGEQIEAISSKHRFPNQSRKRLRAIFADEAKILNTAIDWLVCPKSVLENRKQLAQLVPGLGPKQSSFLFSCVGFGQEIAVLDRHILRYLELIGLIPSNSLPNSWTQYELVEYFFLTYSERHGLRADALDLAIWITMKAAGRNVSKCVQ